MPEAGSVIIKLSIQNRPRVSCCQLVTQPKTTLESCQENGTPLNVVKNHSFLRFGTFNPPVTFTSSLHVLGGESVCYNTILLARRDVGIASHKRGV